MAEAQNGLGSDHNPWSKLTQEKAPVLISEQEAELLVQQGHQATHILPISSSFTICTLPGHC